MKANFIKDKYFIWYKSMMVSQPPSACSAFTLMAADPRKLTSLYPTHSPSTLPTSLGETIRNKLFSVRQCESVV